jgi:hypothetical protein
MVLESGIPELADISALLSDVWAETWRPWLLSNFSRTIREIITEAEATRLAVAGAASSLLSHWDAVEKPYIYEQTAGALRAVLSRTSTEAEATRAAVQAIRIPDYTADMMRLWRVHLETTETLYYGQPTLRSYVLDLYKRYTTTTQPGLDQVTAQVQQIYDSVVKETGAVRTPLAGILDFSRSIFGGVTNIADFLKPFTDPGKFFVPPFGEMFKLVFGPSSLTGGLGELLKNFLPDLPGALKTFTEKSILADVDGMAAAYRAQYEQMYRPSSPRTPEQAHSFATTWEALGNAAVGAVIAAQIGAETLSAGQVDVSLSSIWQLPYLRAWMGTLEEFRRAKDEAALLIPLRYYHMAQHTPMVPGPSDLVRFYVREAFLPEKQVNLDPGMVSFMKLHGYSEQWTRAYWGAHWQLPPLTQLYEMFQREIIDEKTLRAYLVYHDYLPQEHDWLIKAAYQVMPRVDLRRAWEAGLISDEELERRMRWTGYSPQDARLEAATQRRIATKTEVEDLLKEHEHLYVEGLIEEADLRAAYMEMGVAGQLVDLRLQALRMRREREARANQIRTALDMYRRGLRPELDTAKRLRDLGVPLETINYLILTNAPRERARQLSLSQLSRALRYGRISPEEYRKRLLAYGYQEEDAALLEAAVTQDPLVDEEERIEREILRLKTSTYRTAYRDGRIDRTTLLRNLMLIGLPEELAMAIAEYEDARLAGVLEEKVASEDRSEQRRVRSLKAQAYRTRYREGLIPRSELVSGLLWAGYSEVEAEAIAQVEDARLAAKTAA